MTQEDIIKLITTTFANLQFEEESHKYTIGLKNFTSTSNKIENFYEKFDEIKISENYAKKNNLSQEEVLNTWKKKRDKAIRIGNEIHKFAEDYIEGRITNININDKLYLRKKFVVDFWNNLSDTYKCILTEQKMYSDKYNFAGTTDFLLFNSKDNSVIVGDYKTNEDLFKCFKNKKMKEPFNFLEDSPFNHYQLQLSYYQMLLEDIGITVSDRLLVWIGKEQYKTYHLENFTDILRTC